MATVLEKLFGRQREREQARASDYHDLAMQIAQGVHPDEEYVDAVLHAAGRTAEQLASEVARIERRLTLVDQLANVEALSQEKEHLAEQLARAGDKLERAKRAYNAVAQPINHRLAVVRNEILQSRDARQELLRTADEQLRESLANVERKLATRSRALESIKDELVSVQATAQSEQREITADPFASHRAVHEENHRRFARRADELEAERQTAQAACDELASQAEAIRQQMLQP